MLYLALSIVGSVSVGVLFKYLRSYQTDILPMIIINYIITSLCAFLIFKVDLSYIPNNLPYLTILGLAFILPGLFVIQFLCVLKVGIIKTDIAQRMSLLLPIIAAIFIFGEHISLLRFVALSIGLLSLWFILNKYQNNQVLSSGKTSIWLPLSVFIGFGLVDILFKQLALYSTVPYTTTLFYVFGTALIISVVSYFSLQKFLFKKPLKINGITIALGCVLGILNFINIYFYLKAHQSFAQSPTVVFAGMNFGVIILGTILGYTLFKEKLSNKNVVGLIMALIAVGLLLYTEFN